MLGTVSLKTTVLVNLCWDSSSLVQETSPTVQENVRYTKISTRILLSTPQFGVSIDFRVQGLETLNQNILRDITLAYAPAFRFSSCHAFMVFFYTQF